jgi:hypothetical protein
MPVVRELVDAECAEVPSRSSSAIRPAPTATHFDGYIEGAESRGELKPGMTGDLFHRGTI